MGIERLARYNQKWNVPSPHSPPVQVTVEAHLERVGIL